MGVEEDRERIRQFYHNYHNFQILDRAAENLLLSRFEPRIVRYLELFNQFRLRLSPVLGLTRILLEIRKKELTRRVS